MTESQQSDTAQARDAPAHSTVIDTVSIVWTALALVVLLMVPFLLQTTTPIFQVLWLTVPLLYPVRYRDARGVGFRIPDAGRAARDAVGAGAAYAVLLLAVEPWAGVYARLLELALDGPDPTFAWLIRFDGPPAWLGLLLFSGLVTLYSEELFFRGWLLHALNRRIRPLVAIVGQAVAFTVFQSIPVLFFSPVQAVLYLSVYAFGLGIVVGIAAHDAESIWPGLAVVTVANFVLTLLLT